MLSQLFPSLGFYDLCPLMFRVALDQLDFEGSISIWEMLTNLTGY